MIIASRSNPPDGPEIQHIMNWCENSAPHHARLLGLSKYPREGSFSTSAAGMAFTLANETYRAMRKGGDCEHYSAQDILGAAIVMLNWEPEE